MHVQAPPMLSTKKESGVIHILCLLMIMTQNRDTEKHMNNSQNAWACDERVKKILSLSVSFQSRMLLVVICFLRKQAACGNAGLWFQHLGDRSR